jgi:hypothetical protein
LITLQEALLNADSPTNLSWLINNFEATGASGNEERQRNETVFDLSATDPSSPSYKEFTLSLDEAESATQTRDARSDGAEAATRDATLALAEQLIACRSVTPEDAGCLQIIAKRLEAIGFDCEFMNRGRGQQPLGTPRRQPPAALSGRPHRRRPQWPTGTMAQRPVSTRAEEAACCTDAAPPT